MPSSNDKNGVHDNTAGAPQTTEPKTKDSEGTTDQPVEESENRFKLLAQAGEFLASPTIRYQDDGNKREFLSRKGLSPTDIETLLSEASSIPPPIPPRTYLPPTPPSNLPQLLASFARSVAYLSVASGIGLSMYYNILFPRLYDSFEARRSLRSHQLELLQHLTEQLRTLKPIRPDDPAQRISQHHQQDEPISDDAEAQSNMGPESFSNAVERLATAANPPPTDSSAVVSISTAYSRTLQAFTDLNAYISSQTYLVPAASSFRLGSGTITTSRALGPAEEEMRREIRALKGLVLNRRSFAPTAAPTAP